MGAIKNFICFFTVMTFGITIASGLKCHMCGEYNEGVGSITPCLDYSEEHPELHLKECKKASEKYCVKYVSQLSTVRDCATECSPKEVWETQTYCCTEDGCNGSSHLKYSITSLLSSIVIASVVRSFIFNQ